MPKITGGTVVKLLTRISHRERCIGPKNRVKFFCDKGLTDSIAGSDANRVYLRSV